MKSSTPTFDVAATGLSLLCLIHCLLLPVLSVALPVAGLLAEMEGLHRLFVLLALPASVSAFLSRRTFKSRYPLWIPALIGCVLLILGAFVEPLHDFETGLTVGGALFLAAAHSVRILLRTHRHGTNFGGRR